jgi:hypothetical protein
VGVLDVARFTGSSGRKTGEDKNQLHSHEAGERLLLRETTTKPVGAILMVFCIPILIDVNRWRKPLLVVFRVLAVVKISLMLA